MTITLSDLAGRPVLDISTALETGQVKHAILDPGSGHLIGFLLAKTPGDRAVLPWEAVKAIGPDAITIGSAADLRSAEGTVETRSVDRSLDPIGAEVLTTSGEEAGKVSEIDLDETSGRVETVTTTDGRLRGEAIVGLGHHALIVRSDGTSR